MSPRRIWLSVALAGIALSGFAPPLVADPQATSPADFAYRMHVLTQGDAAAYRITVPLAVYRKVVHPDLTDVRVFNAQGEPVSFAIERPRPATVAGTATALPLFPLRDDSSQALDAVRVIIESGRAAVDLQSASSGKSMDRVNAYIADGRALEVAVAALRLAWPDEAADFAGRMRIEVSDSLGDWRAVTGGSPVANLHSDGRRLLEQRLEFPPVHAKYWRLSWVGGAAPFMLTAVQAEPAGQNVEARHSSLTVEASRHSAGSFEYDLGSSLPVDRVNLALADTNTVVEAGLQSRARASDPWKPVTRAGFYKLRNGSDELRNGPVPVGPTTDRYWRVSTDPKGGGLGAAAPRLEAEWVPHEIVFIARGAAPFYLAYGNAAAQSASMSLSVVPKNVTVATATLSDPEVAGGDVRLTAASAPFGWKNALLWAVLICGAALLGWMALQLARDVSRS